MLFMSLEKLPIFLLEKARMEGTFYKRKPIEDFFGYWNSGKCKSCVYFSQEDNPEKKKKKQCIMKCYDYFWSFKYPNCLWARNIHPSSQTPHLTHHPFHKLIMINPSTVTRVYNIQLQKSKVLHRKLCRDTQVCFQRSFILSHSLSVFIEFEMFSGSLYNKNGLQIHCNFEFHVSYLLEFAIRFLL